MSSRWQIEFDFQQANRQAEKLVDVADRLEEVAKKKVAVAREELPGYWEGTSARAFQGKQQELETAIMKSAKELRGEATKIRQIAKRIYDAEMRALEIARRRTYDQ